MIEYPTKVLPATDGTEDSATAARLAVALSSKTGTESHVVHVGQTASVHPGVTVTGGSLPTEPYESVLKKARSLLERQAEQVREFGGSVTETHPRIGQPAYEVVGLSDELGADPLVVGSGRPRAVRRAFSGTLHRAALGSVSDYTVRSARCPVLVAYEDGSPGAVCPRARPKKEHKRPAALESDLQRRGPACGGSGPGGVWPTRMTNKRSAAAEEDGPDDVGTSPGSPA